MKDLPPQSKADAAKTEALNKLEAAKFIANYPNISSTLKSIFQSIIDR